MKVIFSGHRRLSAQWNDARGRETTLLKIWERRFVQRAWGGYQFACPICGQPIRDGERVRCRRYQSVAPRGMRGVGLSPAEIAAMPPLFGRPAAEFIPVGIYPTVVNYTHIFHKRCWERAGQQWLAASPGATREHNRMSTDQTPLDAITVPAPTTANESAAPDMRTCNMCGGQYDHARGSCLCFDNHCE